MKNKIAIILTLATATLTARAVDQFIPMPFTITATEYIQGIGYNTGATTNVDAPTKEVINNKVLLENLAQAAFFDHLTNSSTFPLGAKIVFMDDTTDFSHSYFEVTDKEGVELLNVSRYMQFVEVDYGEVVSGIQNNTTGLDTKFAEYMVGKLTFDDTASALPGDKFQVYLQGVLKATASDSTPKNGIYTEKWKATMGTAGGSGTEVTVINSLPLVATGKMSFSGSGVFELQ